MTTRTTTPSTTNHHDSDRNADRRATQPSHSQEVAPGHAAPQPVPAALRRIDVNRMSRRLGIAPREARVLACVDAGLHTAQIAAALNITEHTVKHYFKEINIKLGTHSRLEAMQHWHHAIRDMEREGRPPWRPDAEDDPDDTAPPRPATRR